MSTAVDAILDRRDHAELAGLAPEMKDAVVRRALDRAHAGDDWIDPERLTSLGVTLSRAPHAGLVASALDWLGPAPAPERLVAASALLGGLWQGIAGHDQGVGQFLDVLDHPWARDEDATVTAAYAALRALVEAVHTGGLALPTVRRSRHVAAALASVLPEVEAGPLLARLR